MSKNPISRFLAELMATFTLVVIGAGSVAYLINANVGGEGVLLAAFAHGFAVIALAYTYGHISAHANPAVSTAMLVGGEITLVDFAVNVLAQFVGALAAAAVVLFIYNGETRLLVQHGAGALGNDFLKIVVVEGLFTFLFVSVVFQIAAKGRGGGSALHIGLALAGCILAAGPLTGAALNPARYFGPSLLGGDLANIVPFMIGTFGGGLLAGLVQNMVFGRKG